MKNNETISVLLVEDHKLIRLSIRSSLLHCPQIILSGEATSGEEALEKVRELNPDVVLMDIGLPGLDGITATRLIKEQSGTTRVIMLSAHEDEEIIQSSLAAGANGYCLKDVDPDTLLAAITAVYEGNAWFLPSKLYL